MGEAELTGTVKEQAIDSSFSLDAGGQTVEVRFSGTVDGDTMEGTIDTGGFGGGTFTGKRKSAARTLRLVGSQRPPSST